VTIGVAASDVLENLTYTAELGRYSGAGTWAHFPRIYMRVTLGMLQGLVTLRYFLGEGKGKS